MADLIKPPEKTFSLVGGKLTSRTSSFQERVNANKSRTREQEVHQQADGAMVPNRIDLVLDCSGSMGGEKIRLLKDACRNFLGRCNFADTSIGIQTFGSQKDAVPIALTRNNTLLQEAIRMLAAEGGTPLRGALTRTIEDPITRAVVVSDGDATDWRDHYEDSEEGARHAGHTLLAKYKEAGIPVDCVHIGDSTQGEELLRRIAKETGGIYLKFTDVGSFATAFAYLTPGYRAMLTDGRVSLSQLGASEMK